MSALIRTALIALFALFALPALAVQPQGSAAWTNGGWTNSESSLYTGPGTRYEEIGTVGGGLRIRVDRCSGLWCEIHAKNLHGWMGLHNISFGQGPWRLFGPTPRSPIHLGGPVCFYSGAGYTGTQTCFNGGHVIKDLSLVGLDNSFSSVKVGTGSVLACRDRNFRSYCVILNKDMRHLEGLLNNGITSIEVY
jgi:uncharacterized protein YraI